MKKIYSLLLLLACSIACARAQTVVTMTTSGTWTVPAGVTSANVYIWGGGGGGGGTSLNGGTWFSNGSGGGGGAASVNVLTGLTPGNTYTVTIGAGGTAGSANGSTPGNGGASSVVGALGTFTAGGGIGGASQNVGTAGISIAGGAGGSTGTGTVYAGGGGSKGYNGTSSAGADGYTGAGGGAGGSGGVGSTPANGTCTVITTGGTGTYPGGNGGKNVNCGTTTDIAGAAGSVPGGGGAGNNSWLTKKAGGAGGKGQVVIVYTLPGCTGTPTAGTVSSTLSTVCSGVSYTLSATGTTAGTGITYQWQSRTGANPFANIAGATSLSYTTTQTQATDYQLIVTCTLSGASATTNIVSVAQNSYLTCYCTPTYSTGTGSGDFINNVTIAGTGLSNPGSGASASPYYTLYPQSGSTTGTIAQTLTYTVTVQGGTYSSCYIRGWIDYNQDGLFTAAETIGISPNVGASATGTITFTVPVTALPGTVRLRLRSSDTGPGPGTGDFCGATNSGYGEAEDYNLTLIPATPCSGTPGVAIAAGPAAACPSQAFSLTATNLPVGALTGISYQWQSSPAGAGTFTNITGATTVPYTIANQTTATDYQLIVSCSNSGQSSTSNVVAVGQKPSNICYCIPASTCVNEYIKTVTLNGYTSPTGACNTTGYIDNTSLGSVTTLNQGAAYPVSVLAHINDVSSQVGVWIDYDHSGTFDASEFQLLGTISGTNVDQTFSNTINVPGSAVLGITGMRVRSANASGVASTSACLTSSDYGSFQDYLVTINVGAACNSTPTAGTATASVSTICSGTSFTLNATGFTTGVTGITFQWQSSPAGAGTFTDIAGATTVPYTVASQTAATDYQLVVTCSNTSQTSTTNIVSVVQSSFLTCYCVTTPGTVNAVDIITNVTVTNSLGATLTQASSSNGTNNYTVYNNTPFDLPLGSTTNTIAITYGTDGTQYGAAWIDFNQNGIYEASENIGLATAPAAGSATVTYTFTVPSGATLGNTRLRVRGGSDNAYTAGGACTASSYGETEDYLVNIYLPPPCVAPTAPATGLTLASTTATSVNGSFTAAVPAANGYIILQTAGTATPNTIPVDGTTYTNGATLGNATVVGVGTGTTFTSSSLTGGTQYTYTVYDYNSTACTGGPLYYTATALAGTITTSQVVTYTGIGVWSNAANWSTGVVPNDCSKLVEIAANASVTVDGNYQSGSVTTIAATSAVTVPTGTTLNICGSVTNNGSFTVSGGTSTVGTNGLFNNTLNNLPTATTTVTGGTLKINGNFSVQAGSGFTQSGGAIAIDGNSGGIAANSVAGGTAIVSFASSNLVLTGGTFTIVDPQASSTLTSVLDYNATGNVEASPAHTFIFGDGLSTDAGGVANSMRIRVNQGTGRLNMGSLIVNSGTGTNRYAFLGTGSLGVNGNMTINNGGEFRMNSALYLNGNLTVNTGGTLTTQTNAVNFSSFTGGTAGGATGAQTLINNGTIQNATTAATANFYSIGIRNSNGVTFNSDISYGSVAASTLTFTAGTSGPSILTMANGSKLIQMAGANQSGFGTTAGWINGRFQKAAGTGGINNFYPVGDATTYAPVTVINATGGTVTTAGTITASTKGGEYLLTTGGVPRLNSARINQDKDVNRYWTIEEGGGIAFSAAGIKVVPAWVFPADVDAAATPANFIVGRYLSPTGPWVYPTVSNPLTTSIEALNNNNSGANTIAGDYIVGEAASKPAVTAGLQGAMQSGGTLRNDLQQSLLLPTTDPFGLNTTYAAINNAGGPAGAVTDWVRVDVYNPALPAPALPLESHALLLRTDGSLVDTRGLVPAYAVRAGNLRLAVKHRNHMAVMSNNVLMNDVFAYNFTTSLSQASVLPGDPVQMVQVGGKWCLWAGDVNVGANYAQDYYIETADDAQLQSVLPQSLSGVYNVNDLNLDGYVETADDVLMQLNLPNSLNSTLANY